MKTISNIFIIFIISLFLLSCSDTLKGFKLKKKSTSGDEFLIQKKDPLVLPPDFSKLPNPDEEVKENKVEDDEETQIEMVFKKNNSDAKENENSNSSDSVLQKSILKKIQKQ